MNGSWLKAKQYRILRRKITKCTLKLVNPDATSAIHNTVNIIIHKPSGSKILSRETLEESENVVFQRFDVEYIKIIKNKSNFDVCGQWYFELQKKIDLHFSCKKNAVDWVHAGVDSAVSFVEKKIKFCGKQPFLFAFSRFLDLSCPQWREELNIYWRIDSDNQNVSRRDIYFLKFSPYCCTKTSLNTKSSEKHYHHILHCRAFSTPQVFNAEEWTKNITAKFFL